MSLSGPIGIPVFFAPANATINHVITGDTQKYRIFEGQAPTIQPPRMLVWQPIQCQELLSGGACKENSQLSSKEQITFLVKAWFNNNGRLQPYATIAITTPNGTHLAGEAKEETLANSMLHVIHLM